MKLQNLVLSVAASLWVIACTTPEPAGLPQPPPVPAEKDLKPENDLTFDMRYYDSIEMTPRSARTERELAIFRQLNRLNDLRAHRQHDRETGVTPKPDTDSIFEQLGSGNPVRGFASRAEKLADIYRKIDSLKVLAHIPLTPH